MQDLRYPDCAAKPSFAACDRQDGRVMGVREPGPKGVCIVVQVPLGASFHELP
jgi:hypothetical protein